MFDNYDDPQLPDIRIFSSYFTQESILITIRFSRITFAKPMRLNKFGDLNQSLTILTRRWGRQAQEGTI